MTKGYFIHVRYDPETQTVQRDFVELDSLDMAFDAMLPAHAAKGWKIRQEVSRKDGGVIVLGVWKPSVDSQGQLSYCKIYTKRG